LATAYQNIVFAPIKISLSNTVLTAILLLGALPLAGIHVPLAKTLVVITFVVGLLPVIGNLLSNTAVTIAGLSVSLWVGVTALGFLILIHKRDNNRSAAKRAATASVLRATLSRQLRLMEQVRCRIQSAIPASGASAVRTPSSG
jgi:hypothetical protein